jgi:gluconolactonase
MRSAEPFVHHDAAFARVVGAAGRLERLVGCDAHEGPVYLDAEDALYVTTLPLPSRPARIDRIALGDEAVGNVGVTTLDTEAVMPNGMTSDHVGRLVVCEQGDLSSDACISVIDPATGARAVVVDRWRDRRLNSPNDVVVAPDGAIWFTDPSYGHLQGFRPEPEVGEFVYRFDPRRGDVDVVADGFDKPNGVALSPDGLTLYVTDSGANQTAGSFHPDRPHHVVAFDIAGGRRLTGRRLLAVTAPGIPDGLKTDDEGRVYVSSTSGVLVLSPEGDLLGEIAVPGAVNFTFGGRDRNVLLITADTAVWAAHLAARSASPHLNPLPRPLTTGA